MLSVDGDVDTQEFMCTTGGGDAWRGHSGKEVGREPPNCRAVVFWLEVESWRKGLCMDR